ncbi:Cysteine-rich receptor protein kinase 25 [Spatholobus suberectus]|nr:Cysteine-rich receptor protein kinase 25 [Spatholobus suberectus]
MRLMFDTMNKTADEAASSPIGAEKYATNQANISGFQSLYCLVQCTQDLSTQSCRSCLSSAIGLLPWCCEGKQGGRILYPSCNVRYESYPSIAPTPLLPHQRLHRQGLFLQLQPILPTREVILYIWFRISCFEFYLD